MNQLKNIIEPFSTPEDRLTPLFRKIKYKCRELEFLRLITSFILSDEEYTDRDALFYHLLIKKAEGRKKDNWRFIQVITELVTLLSNQDRIGLAYYYSLYVSNPEPWFIELQKEIKARILIELHQSSQQLEILVVDDCPVSLHRIKKNMMAYNQQVQGFTSPQSAITHLAESTIEYDLIICDYNVKVPEINGITFLQEAKEIKNQENCVRVLCSAMLPDIVPERIFQVSKNSLEAFAGLIHAILIGKECLQ